MVFLELIGFLIFGVLLGGWLYSGLLSLLVCTFGKSDFILPGFIAVTLVFLGVCINFEFSLITFLTHSEEPVTGPISAINSVVDKVKYPLLVAGSIIGAKLSYRVFYF
ncbi:hypothetical protein AAEU31_12860 [Pseudoalteromonas sp. SSMSWG5]|uniref:hypothetical protein n=1 Tax=Pseudoalteromonas sp. SSMSWG5 TaxID=3139396 RepID=UPI003BAC7E3B